jgi:23S rRNA pseudouridine955/2504/2580 synthase
VLSEGNGVSYLEVELLTGKTHQIRAHLAAVDHPILGDPLYGNERINKKFALTRQALWASKLVFTILDSSHPLAYLNGKVIVKDEPQWLHLLQKKTV